MKLEIKLKNAIIFIIYITIMSILLYFAFNKIEYKPITAWFLGVAHAVIGFLGILNKN